jgi:NMD protein affecting ribosome stability and mRNA decay
MNNCIRCGKPRDNDWLLACVDCYVKEHPEEAKNYGR